MKRLVWVVTVLSVAACAGPQAERDATGGAGDTPESIAADYWEARSKRWPTGATFRGDRRYDDRLADLSDEAHRAWLDTLSGFRVRVERESLRQLEGQSRLTAQVLATQLRDALAGEVCQQRLWGVDQLSGWHVTLPELGTYQIVDSPSAAAAYLARVRAVGPLIDQELANMKRGLDEGYVAARVTVRRVVKQLDAMLKKPTIEEPDEEPDTPYVDVVPRATGLDDQAKMAFRADILQAVGDGLRPALERYRDFLRDTYLPKARTKVGVGNNRDGAACYAARIRRQTGSTLDPAAIYQIGLDELERLRARMLVIAKRAGHQEIASYIAALDGSPDQHLTTREELLEHNSKLVRRALAALPRAFGLLPPISVGVRAIERFREADAVAAYYYAAADDGSRPAYYYVNTHRPETRPLYNMEALAFHEAVPGHHLQISIAQSLDDLPKIRRHGGFSAYVEGWALYSELVADELELYSTDATRFGMLNYQAWRATRLVVDTGMHALGWDRERAITFMHDNLAFPENEIANEVDRYIVWPGQALAYMMGRMHIQKLRGRAEKRLGSAFDLRAFHDRVLENGPLPLGVLEEVIDAWLSEPVEAHASR
ncbi:MAG: DUF885 domain-containing protein [Myxococcota bacterium]